MVTVDSTKTIESSRSLDSRW